MQLCKVQLEDGHVRVGAVTDAHVRFLDLDQYVGIRSLSDLLHSDDPIRLAQDLIEDRGPSMPLDEVTVLPPVDAQEVWAAGVTYKRSQEARERESAGAGQFYDLVYSAPRPELFFKATASRVVGPGARVYIRRDSRWTVPEPELALFLSPRMKIVGYTIGNDMSARDIEGENPLYLPQAKVYDHACALGPVVTLTDGMPPRHRVTIRLTIERRGDRVFDGTTTLSAMARSFEELVEWLGRDNTFPHGAVLLTGTGIVPPDDFALISGDLIDIEISGIGRLSSLVEQRS
jgi:2-dehydro-3-deoxy-D-arabinonate dehydratase